MSKTLEPHVLVYLGELGLGLPLDPLKVYKVLQRKDDDYNRMESYRNNDHERANHAGAALDIFGFEPCKDYQCCHNRMGTTPKPGHSHGWKPKE